MVKNIGLSSFEIVMKIDRFSFYLVKGWPWKQPSHLNNLWYLLFTFICHRVESKISVK